MMKLRRRDGRVRTDACAKVNAKPPTAKQIQEEFDAFRISADKDILAYSKKLDDLRGVLESERQHDAEERKKFVARIDHERQQREEAHNAATQARTALREEHEQHLRDLRAAVAEVRDLEDRLEETEKRVRDVAALAAEKPTPPPVNEHADAHETISNLAHVIVDLSEARARALRSAPPNSATPATPSTTENELRATLADALDLLYSDAVSFVDVSGPLLAGGIRDRAIRLGCGTDDVSDTEIPS